MKKYFILWSICFICTFTLNAQFVISTYDVPQTISLNTTLAGVNNGAFAGTGFATSPASGQLHAGAWAVIGTSDGDKDFNEVATSGVFAKGSSTGAVTDPGIYAFEVETGNYALGIQASDNDFAPGNIVLKMQNSTGSLCKGIAISYDIWIYNDQNRSTKIIGEYSPNNSFWVPIPQLEVVTDLTASAIPGWTKSSVSVTQALNTQIGANFYFRWRIVDNGGTGNRDEIAIDNFSLTLYQNLPCVVLNPNNFPNNTFKESFEDNSDYRHCWTQEFVSASNSWTYQTGSNGGSVNSAFEGTKNARFTSTPGGPQITKLVSPTFDLSGVPNPVLRFWYAQESFVGNQNELKVYYRTASSNPWIELAHFIDNNAVWTIEPYMILPNPSATYQIAFEGIDKNGRANVIDNVSISSFNSLPQIANIDVNNQVQNISVCLGTANVNVPISMLPSSIVISDTHGYEHTVSVQWSIPEYDGDVISNYTALGSFSLPLAVNQTNPVTSLEVSAIVSVINLPELSCPNPILLDTETTITLQGATPVGGQYFYNGNPITQFNSANFSNGEYTITYVYTNPSTTCTNSCDFIITVQLPSEITIPFDIYNDVQDVYACLGTPSAVAAASLSPTMTILDSNGGEHVVSITWNITGYNANVINSYNAIGTFSLPTGVLQTNPVTPLVIYATVMVVAYPSVSCPNNQTVLITDSPFTFQGAEPAGGEYRINGNPYFLFNPSIHGIGEHTVIYYYSDPITGCGTTCSYTITVSFETGISEYDENIVSIFPNPNTGEFNIVFSDVKTEVRYEILDLKGSVLISKVLNSVNNSVLNIVHNLQSGIYYIRLVGDEKLFIEKIIVE